jgi:transcriptional regulator with XRE-family HTH domain
MVSDQTSIMNSSTNVKSSRMWEAPMIRMKQLRIEKGWSGLRFSRESGLAPATISQTENRRAVPYESQLKKAADALGWTGELRGLLDEVDDR